MVYFVYKLANDYQYKLFTLGFLHSCWSLGSKILCFVLEEVNKC